MVIKINVGNRFLNIFQDDKILNSKFILFPHFIREQKVSYSFKFKNTGNAPLVISSANASCGCTVPEYTKTPIQPDDEGFIDVTFDSGGKSGMVSKTVTIIANTIPNSTILTISAEISVPEKTNTN